MIKNKILIIDDEDEIREVMIMMIETIGNYEVVEAHSGNHAINILKNVSDFGLVFCDYRMNDGNGGDVYQWIHQNRPELPYVLVSTAEPRDIDAFKGLFEHNTFNDHIVKPFDDEMLRKAIERVFSNQEGIRKKIDHHDKVSFCSIKIEDFLKYNLACKVFIKINEEKFIKIRDYDDESTELILRYKDKGMKELYLLKPDYEILLKDRKVEVNEQKNSMLSMMFAREVIRNLGVQEYTISQIDELVGNVETEVLEQSELSSFLKDFKTRKDYITDLAYLNSYISCVLAKEMAWSSSTIFKKLIFASIFKDISLANEEHAKILDVRNKSFFELDLDTQTLVKNHMYISAQYFDKMQSISDDVRNMILTHHERPDGTGFPKGVDGSHVSPMEALFIFSMNVSHELLKNNLDHDAVKKWLNDNIKDWSRGNFKRPQAAVLKMFGQKT